MKQNREYEIFAKLKFNNSRRHIVKNNISKVQNKVLIIGMILLLCSCSSNLTTENSTTPTSFEVGVVSYTTTITLPTETSVTTDASETSEVSTLSATELTSAVTEDFVVAEDIPSDDLAFDPALLDDYDSRTKILFTAIKTNDIKSLNLLGGTRSDGVYDFIKNIKFGNFTINSSKTADVEGMTFPPKTYNVTLSVLESNDSRFPVGNNTYEITALDAGFGPYFNPLHLVSDKTNKVKITDMIETKTLSDNANVCYNLTLEMMPFYGRNSLDIFNIPDNDKDSFYNGLARFFSHIPSIVPSASVETYDKTAKQLFGIDTAFNEQNINPLWYGANMLDAVLVSETDKSVVIDYYADSLLLVKAFTVEYNFDTTNEFRFISIKNLYDSGFEPSRYST
jgi:hypothetical protein